MSAGLVRTTTYFDESLLTQAKRLALDQQKSLYKVLNEKLGEALGIKPLAGMGKFPRTINLEEVFGPPFNLGLKKKKFVRADYYE